MFSIEKCRKIDPSLHGLSDEELLEIKDTIYGLANLAFESWQQENVGSKNPAWASSESSGQSTI